jgi:hypothetical protein
MRHLLASAAVLLFSACVSSTEPSLTPTDEHANSCTGSSANCGHGFGKNEPPKFANND